MYDYILTLIGASEWVRDDSGNYIPKETQTTVYSAAQAGLNPEQVFEINGFEYNGETEVEFLGERYSVIRTYRTSYETVELTCERKAKHGERTDR